MPKLDLRRELKDLYRASARTPVLVDVPELPYLRLDGSGQPGAADFQAGVAALYGLAYGLKFRLKREDPEQDFAVMPLEALWSAETPDSPWRWSLLSALPPLLGPEPVEAARADVLAKRGDPLLSEIRLDRFAEGRCAQILHVGPYDAEQTTFDRLAAFVADQGLTRRGPHHEIYLSDPRRTAPDQLRTILRWPVG